MLEFLRNFGKFPLAAMVRDVSTIGGSLAVSYAIQLLSYPLILRLYSPIEYGHYSIIFGISALLLPLITARSEQLVQLAKRNSDYARVLGAIVYLGGFAAFVLFLLIQLVFAAFPFLAWQMMDTASTALACAIAWMSGVFLAFRYALLRGNRGNVAAAAFVVRPLALLAFSSALAFAGPFGASGRSLLLAQLAADTVAVLISCFGLSSKVMRVMLIPKPRKWFQTLRPFSKTSMTLIGADLMSNLTIYLPVFCVNYFFGTREAGWFSLCFRLAFTPVSFLTAALGDIFYREAALRHRSGMKIAKLIKDIVTISVILGLSGFSFVFLLSPQIMELAFGPQWIGAAPTLSAICVVACCAFISRATNRLIYVLQKNRYLLTWHTVSLCLTAAVATLPAIGYGYHLWIWTYVLILGAVYIADLAFQYSFAIAYDKSLEKK